MRRALHPIALLALLLTPSVGSGQARRCGVERWPVKIAVDLDADEIRPTPVNTTIYRLVQIPRPIPPFSFNRRRGPYERTTYRVTARLLDVLPESDGDVHLVLADTGSVRATLVAEIPDSSCAVGSKYAAQYAEARRAMRTAGPGALVEIEGIGFFDYRHGQRGMAENGFELHPVVSLRVVAGAKADTIRGERGDTVWVNSGSRVYHCRGSQWYGRTKQGYFTSQREAQAAGVRPAYGRRCQVAPGSSFVPKHDLVAGGLADY